MATVYVLDTIEYRLKNFFTMTDSEQNTPNFSILHKSNWSNIDLRKYVNFCKGNDLFYVKDAVKFPIHYHNEEEKRLIINGSGTFFVPINNFIHIIECETGDLITLNPGLAHWFETNNELLAARFFGDADSHTVITKDIKENYKTVYNELSDIPWKEKINL